jgi:hypothetical protein
MRATRIHVVADEAEAQAMLPQLGFVGSDMVSCHIGVTPGLLAAGMRPVRLWSDFRAGPEGLGISLIAVNDAAGSDLARLLQRFQELGNYRNLALMGLPMARACWPRLDASEAALRAGHRCCQPGHFRRCAAGTRFRAQPRPHVTGHRDELSHERDIGLCAVGGGTSGGAVQPVDPGLSGAGRFTQRRLLPAIRTAQAYRNRLDDVTARAAHFTSLLRTASRPGSRTRTGGCCARWNGHRACNCGCSNWLRACRSSRSAITGSA